MRKVRPSDSQLRALRNLAGGLPAGHHVRGASQHGGFWGTWLSLINRGWMTREEELTEAGRAVVVESESVR